jgi:hypothetical protein
LSSVKLNEDYSRKATVHFQISVRKRLKNYFFYRWRDELEKNEKDIGTVHDPLSASCHAWLEKKGIK